MDIMMNPIVAAKNAPGAASKNQGSEPPATSFAKHIASKTASEPRRNQLGTDKSANRIHVKNNHGKAKNTEAENDPEATGVNALLMQFMLDLQALAKAKQQESAGEWTFTVADQDILQQIGVDAGMDEDEISQLLAKLAGGESEFNLDEFLGEMAKHFESLAEGKSVTAPETDLALLENILARLGMAMDKIKDLADNSVVGDGSFDLNQFLQGLNDALGDAEETDQQTLSLSSWEVEQLSDMLSRAGVSDAACEKLLPTKNQDLKLSIASLKDLLSQGINDVELNKAKADLPSFLSDLSKILSEAGFQTKTAGWTPVVQDSVAEAYKDLLASVDMANVKVQVMPRKTMENIAQALPGHEDNEEEAEIMELIPEGDVKLGGKAKNLLANNLSEAVELEADADGRISVSDGHTPQLSLAEKAAIAAELAPRSAEATTAPRHLSDLQQRAFAQISQGVAHGLEKGEHHLILRLYPQELGEVKIDLMVRDEKVAVSFTMENSKVKEVMDSNLDDFKQNMEQKGFSLGECMVNVGDNSQTNDNWQRFEQAWQLHGGGQSETLADLPEENLYNRTPAREVSAGGISIVV